LAKAVTMWETPMARDYRSESSEIHGKYSPALSRQVLTTPQRGKTGSDRVVLSPLFVEALMGLPMHWSIARIGYAVSATPLCHSKPPSPSESLPGG
jgi:hypothetical protein